jgi:hypothetical protein
VRSRSVEILRLALCAALELVRSKRAKARDAAVVFSSLREQLKMVALVLALFLGLALGQAMLPNCS